MTRKFKIVLLALIAVANAYAQEQKETLGPLVTDRPDATESPSVVPVGFIQVETGTFYESFKENSIKEKTTTFNTTLVRVGLLDNLELRLGWDFTEQAFEFNGNEIENVLSGFSPLLLGAKVAITQENGWLPEIGLIGHLQLPFLAATDYRPETTGVDFRFSFAHTLSENSSLSYNLGAEWGGDSPEANYVYTLAYGYSITDKLGTFVELYGELPEDSRPSHLWDAGFTYLLSNNVQLDLSGGTSLNNTQDLYISGGISFRIPK